MAVSAQEQASRARLLAMFLVGAGLLILGVAAFFMLPKPDAAASDERSAYAASGRISRSAAGADGS